MIKRAAFLITILTLLLGLPGPAAVSASVERTVTTTSRGLQVHWSLPQPRISSRGDGTFAISIAGLDQVHQPGAALLPEDALTLALPDGAQPYLSVRLLQTSSLALPGPLAHVPDQAETPVGLVTIHPDTAAPAGDAPITLQELGRVRGVRLARLSFRPVSLRTEQLEFIQQAEVVIDYAQEIPANLTNRLGGLNQHDPIQSLLAGTVANPAQLAAMRALSATPADAQTALPNRAGQAVIEVASPGLTQVTYAALQSAGFALNNVDPHNLHLEWAGGEIPTEWEGDTDAVFEPGERLLFYAQPRFNRWTDRDAYFLSAGSTPGLQMTSRSTSAQGKPTGTLWISQTFEQNNFYTPDCYCAPIPAGRDGDRWIWDTLRQPDRTSAAYTLELANVDESQAAQLSLWLISYTELELAPDHRVAVSLNGSLLDTLNFDGKQAYQADLTIPAGLLHTGSNTLNLALPGVGSQVEGVWLDAAALRYAHSGAALAGQLAAEGDAAPSQYVINLPNTTGARAYDISDPAAPQRLTEITADATHLQLADPAAGLPRRYAVVPPGAEQSPAALRLAVPLNSAPGADYLIITHPDFANDLAELVALRTSQGLAVKVEDVRAIYDAADGRPQPEAIRAYLAAAYAAWQPRPLYVLLVGDGTTDPRRYLAGSSPTFIPPYLVETDPVIGETAADNRYAAVDGADLLPDLLIGRLPVNSHVEAAITLTKLVQYERSPAFGDWSRRFTWIADRSDPTVGDFPAENAALAALYQGERYTSSQLAYLPGLNEAQIHAATLAAWNESSGLLLYNGHGSNQQWGADYLFHLNDLPVLKNGARLPVLLEMTCLTGSFQVPALPTLDETLLRRSGRGVVAAWGSTGLGLTVGHMLLARGFLDQVMAEPQTRLGAAALAGKINLVTNTPALDYLSDVFTLLGDPATRLNYRFDAYLPAVKR